MQTQYYQKVSACSHVANDLELTPTTYTVAIVIFSPYVISILATTLIGTGGIKGQVHFFRFNSRVLVQLDTLYPRISGLDFEIREYPVDYSLAPNVRCKSEHVGTLVRFSDRQGNWIFTTIRDLFLHSIVLLVRGEIISCGTIIPFSLPDLTAVVNFRTNTFGRLYVLQWSG